MSWLRGEHRGWAIFVAALALRLGYLFWQPLHAQPAETVLQSDMHHYDTMAQSVAFRRPMAEPPFFVGYHPLVASSYMQPGYPLFLAALYRLWGRDVSAVYAAQALLSAATVAILFVLLARVTRMRWALLLTGLAAVHPKLILYNAYLLTETLTLFLLILFVLAAFRCLESPKPRVACMAGLLYGLLTVTRPNFLAGLPFVALVLAGGLRRKALGLAFLAECFACILPFTLRNHQLHGRLILLTANAPFGFYETHVVGHPLRTNRLRPLPADWDAMRIYDHVRRESLSYIVREPLDVAGKSLASLAFMLSMTYSWPVDALWGLKDSGGVYALVMFSQHLPWVWLLFPLSLLALRRRRDPRVLLLYVLQLSVLLTTALLIAPDTRYRLPIELCAMLLGGFALGGLDFREGKWVWEESRDSPK